MQGKIFSFVSSRENQDKKLNQNQEKNKQKKENPRGKSAATAGYIDPIDSK